jgi:hypothetical protein
VAYSTSTTVGFSCSQTVVVLATLTAAIRQNSKPYVVLARFISGSFYPKVPFSPLLGAVTPTGSTATPLEATNSGKSHLSVGSIAGIAIGGLSLVLLAVVFFLFHRRKQSKRAIPLRPRSHQSSDAGLPELVTADMNPYDYDKSHELDARESQMTATTYPVPVELQAPVHTDAELDSSPRIELETSTAISPIPEIQQNRPTPYSVYLLPELHSSSRIPHETPNVTIPRNLPAHLYNEHGSPSQERNIDHLPVSNNRESQVTQLKASKALLDERIARERRLAQMEEEQANIQKEIERLRSSKIE